ncbi:MAG: VWA domain-containing protein [Haliscomenobacter sp.]|nr:VWA domain-containing protein [Haliscomenobacter sp.]MBK9492850.1 VWA domain-containing protein [Haliscomenobacter sp.]HPH18406.1 VWA domain-containing protein [Haliscomenobacter sp.]
MFRFEHPVYLYALALLPILILLMVGASYARKKALARMGNPELIQRLMPDRSPDRLRSKNILFLIGLFFIAIALANPQWGTKTQAVRRQSIDIIFALDISQSMLCQDIAPSRLIQGQRLCLQLIEKLSGNRLGVILFAGEAYMQVPLTTDYEAVSLLLQSANPDMISSQGTSIGEALAIAQQNTSKSNGNRVVLVITDGEDHEARAETQARQAARAGMKIFTIGIGSEEGGFVPFMDENGMADYKRDISGKPVLSKLNAAVLRKLATLGGGSFFRLSAEPDVLVDALLDKLNKVEKREYEQRVVSEYRSHFQVFLLIGLGFLLGEFLMHYRQRAKTTSKGVLFKKGVKTGL